VVSDNGVGVLAVRVICEDCSWICAGVAILIGSAYFEVYLRVFLVRFFPRTSCGSGGGL